MNRAPIEAEKLLTRIAHVAFDDFFLCMRLIVLGHTLLSKGADDRAELVFDAVDRLADLLAPPGEDPADAHETDG